MNYKQGESRKKSFHTMRGIMGITMGLVYLLIAAMIIYMQKMKQIDIGDTFSYIAGGLMAAYGLFRIYRGWMFTKGKGF